jgi:hypothetical protein
MTNANDPEDRVQLNVTFRRETLDELNRAFPTALEDSERIRQAVAHALERHSAVEYTVRNC